MDVRLPIALGALFLDWLLITIDTARDRRTWEIPRAAAAQVGLSWKAEKEMLTWLAADEGSGGRCLLYLGLWLTAAVFAAWYSAPSIIQVGILGVLSYWVRLIFVLGVLAFFIFIAGLTIGGWLGAQGLRARCGDRLLTIATRAEEQASSGEAVGDGGRARGARQLAAHLHRILQHAPAITGKQFVSYHTAGQVANLIESYIEERDDDSLCRWHRIPDTPLWEDPGEEARCNLLNRIRAEIWMERGAIKMEPEEARRWIDELRSSEAG